MRHHSTSHNLNGDHYAVGINGGPAKLVLAQLQEEGNQSRVALTIEEARHFAQLLLSAANEIDAE